MSLSTFLIAGVFSAPSLLLVDSAVKGTLLLMLAAILTVILRRDSAAARYLVWLLAIVAMLAAPALSAILPQWRVLPQWASVSPASAAVAISPPSLAKSTIDAIDVAQHAEPRTDESPLASADQPAAALRDKRPVLVGPEAILSSASGSLNWQNALPLAWAIGFCVLILRLIVARWILWNTQRQAAVIWDSRRPTNSTQDAIATVFEAASLQLGLCRRGALLIHPEKTIPMVWGTVRYRLLLPAAARLWSGEQVRSVLLHELAHIKRRDTLAQLVTQIACALHWFNPLVWIAVWRLGVERERACDDLVLASGVRPSAYAGHLLEVVTALSPARWTRSYGLAMARQSSIEGRLVAVLSENLNRRGVPMALAAIALAIAVCIAVPLAMLRAADDKPAAAVQPNPAQQQASKSEAQANDEPQKAKDVAVLPGRLFVNAGLRTTKDERRLFQSVIAIAPNTGTWTGLQNLSKPGISVPLSPVRVSPDGRTMLFMRENEIWRCDAPTGENPARVFQKGQPKAWAPDGKEFIAVVEKDSGKPDSTENWRVSADGKNQSPLPLPIGEVIEDWSPDGRWLLGWSHADGQLYIMKLDGSGRKQLTNTNGNASRNEHPRFSPDGLRIVYRQALYQGDPTDWRYSLRTINIDGTNDREVLGETKVGQAPAKATWTAPMGTRWSPDGKYLAVVLFDHDRSGGILAINGNWRLAIIDADGKNLHELKLEGVLTTVLEGDGPEWRSGGDTEQLQPPAVQTPKPEHGTKLQTGIEEKLQWGEPVNGLRAAILIRQIPGEPKAGDRPELYLVVQNVSEAPVRLTDINTAANVNLRNLYLKIDGKTQMGLGAREPALGDLMLQPREVALLPMFSPAALGSDKPSTGSLLAEGTLKDTRQTMVAHMQIENAPPGAWKGKLVAGETGGAVAAGHPWPKDKQAQALFIMWQGYARTNGDIPGGLVGRLGNKVNEFIRNNSGDAFGDPYAKKMAPLAPRFDATRDWTPADIVPLLDDIAAVSTIPLETTMEEAENRNIRKGAPLPPELAGSPWGEPNAEGLRVARPLDPQAASYPIGTPLRSRIVLHNAGKASLLLRTVSWMQPGYTARDGLGNSLAVDSVYWTTLGRLQTSRLAPGEFCEILTPGFGVGKNAGRDEWADVRVGSWVDVADGVDVTLLPGKVDTFGDYGGPNKPASGLELKREIIREHLERERPLPASAADRESIVRRVTRDIFGDEATPEEVSAFVTDKSDDPLAALSERLLGRAGLAGVIGDLTPGVINFRTMPVDPDAANRPKVALGPGQYSLDKNARLIIVGRGVDGRRTSDVEIRFWAANPQADPPGKPYKIQVPDGFGTWAMTCRPRSGILWILTKGEVRKIDYRNPAEVTETPITPGSSDDMPGEFRDAVKRILKIYGISAADQEALLSKSAAILAPATETPK